MNKLFSVATLDFRLLKPNLKVSCVVYCLGIILAAVAKSGETVFAFGILILTTFNLIFSTIEKDNLSILYGTLPVSRKTMVLGRYMLAFLLAITTMILCLVASISIDYIINKEINVTLQALTFCSTLSVYIAIVSIQFPLYFKLGYTKTQRISLILILAVAISIPFITAYVDASELSLTAMQTTLFCLTPLLFSLALSAISCYISYKICDDRE